MIRFETILDEIKNVFSKINEEDVDKFVDILSSDRRIFVIGEGRSGFMGKSFAMRLMHLGATVYVVGETITPAIEEDDIMVAISGSGTTRNVVMAAEKAAQLGCIVLAVTTNLESDLRKVAKYIIHVPAATKYRRKGESQSVQPLGSLFDQCAHILFDSICLSYSESKKQNNSSAFLRHSNLE